MKLWQKQSGKCAVTGRPMTYEENKGRFPTNVSIDRIDPDGFYTPENVRLVCFQINQMRNLMTDDQLRWWCDAILKGRQSSIALKDIPEDTIHEFISVKKGGRKREVRDENICCSCCKGWKPFSAFSKIKRSTVGRKSECKDCFNKANKARLQRKQSGTLMKRGRQPRNVIDGNLKCNTCGRFKPIADFEQHAASTHGVMSRCKECSSSRVIHQVTSNLAQYLRRKAYDLKNRKRFVACVNPNFLIGMLWHRQEGNCMVTGLPMAHRLGDRYHPENASVDRIDSSRNYVPENVRLVCWAVNHMKGELTDDELDDWCAAVVSPVY